MTRQHMKVFDIKIFVAFVMALVAVQPGFAALSGDYYTQQSALSSGHWVKIKVTESGMHQITDAELRAMGFTEPEKVAVYGYPAVSLSDYRLTSDSSDDLPPVAMMRHDGKLIFYAEADVAMRVVKRTATNGSVTYPTDVRRNYYADYGTYFLTDALPQGAPQQVAYNGTADVAVSTTSLGMVHFEEELYNDGTIGARFLGERFKDRPKQAYTFEMPGFEGLQRIQFLMVLGLRVDQSKTMPITLPSGTRANLSVSPVKEETYAYQGFTQPYSDTPKKSETGLYSIIFNATGAQAGGLDYLTAAYPRSNRLTGAAQEVMAFRTLSLNQRIAFDGVTPSTKLWAFADGEPMRELLAGAPEEGDAEGRVYVTSPGQYDLSTKGKCLYVVAFDPDETLKSVVSMGEVGNQNLHGMEVPHMLIVTTPLLKAEAERLAQAHRTNDGIDVAVVDVDEAYNEFSSGTPHLMAVRRLARMFADKGGDKFRSVLLFGAADYDNRGLTRVDKEAFRNNTIPMYMREDIAGSGKLPESYASDAVVGMLAEDNSTFDIGRGMMTVNVARIPARSVAEAHSAVSKAIKHMTAPMNADLMNRALLMCDDGDKNGHMADANGLAARITASSPSTTIYKAYNTIYPFKNGKTEQLNRCATWVLKKGTAFMGYSGHATPRDLGAEMIWGTKLVLETDYERPPFTMLATCRALYFDHDQDNLGESMLYHENGGAIALVGALREVYKEYNQSLNVALGDEFFSAKPGATFGDVFRKARNRMVPTDTPTGSGHFYDLIYNTLSYNLIGDPELKLPLPTGSVELQAVDGKSVASVGGVEIEDCRLVEVKGRVCDAAGNATDATFDGEVTVTVFDNPHKQQTVNHDSTSSKEMVTFDESMLYEGKGEVKNGEFRMKIYLPTPNYCDSVSRMVFWAATPDGRGASGTRKVVINSGKNSGAGAEYAPEITAMYVGDSGFRDGDVVGGNVRLHAEVAPNEIGIAGANSQFGRKAKVLVDGGRSLPEAEHSFVQSTDGGGVLDMDVTGMADGKHTLTFSVSNNAGQTASRSISFTVVNSAIDASLMVDECPAVAEANISLEHNYAGELAGRLVVKNASGDVVFTDENASFPYCWKLKDDNGSDVADGLYIAEAYVAGQGVYGFGKQAEIVVFRGK